MFLVLNIKIRSSVYRTSISANKPDIARPLTLRIGKVVCVIAVKPIIVSHCATIICIFYKFLSGFSIGQNDFEHT